MKARHVSGDGGVVLAAVLLFSFIFAVPHALAQEEVGQLGDLRAVRFEGCKLVPEAQVRAALRADAEVQTAASPSASLTHLLNTVQRRLQIGYEEAGFLRARVLVRPDDSGKCLLVRVEEGARYTAGRVRVEGARQADVKAIERALIEPKAAEASRAEIKWDEHAIVIPTWKEPEDEQDAPWRVGRPAALSEQGRGKLLVAAREALVKQGLCWADVSIEPVPLDDGTAELLVRLKHEGPRAVLDEIKITGLKVNEPQEVLKFLELQRGAAVDLTVLRRVRERLWETGRFVKHDVRAEISREHPGQVKLTLDLREHPRAAALGTKQPIDAPAAAMRRFAESLKRIAAGERAIVAVADVGRLHIRTVFQNGKGIVIRARRDAMPIPAATAPATTKQARGIAASAPASQPWAIFAPEPMDLTWVSTADRLEFSSSIAGRRYATAGENARYQVIAKVDCVPPEDPDKQNLSFEIGAGFKTVSQNRSGGVALQCTLAPLLFFDLAHPPAPPRDGRGGSTTAPASLRSLVSKDGVVTLTEGNLVVRFEEATGDLVELAYRIVDEDNGDEARLRLTAEPGALERELAVVAADAPLHNDYDAKYPISSGVQFLAEWYAKCPLFNDVVLDAANLERGQAVVAKLLALKALAPLEDAFDRGTGDDDEEFFSIPNDPAFSSSSGSLTAAQLRGLLYGCDNLFHYGSWSWTIVHQGVLILTGGSTTGTDELRRVMTSGETGPVGCLAIAAALRSVDPVLSRGVAQTGLKRLSADEFAQDYRVLFQDGQAGARLLNNLAQGIAELSEPELNDLCALLPARTDEPVRFVWKLARSAPPGVSMEKLLAEKQREWWDGSLRKVVEAELRKLAEAR